MGVVNDTFTRRALNVAEEQLAVLRQIAETQKLILAQLEWQSKTLHSQQEKG